MADKIVLTKAQYDALSSIYPKLSALKQSLGNVVHPSIIKEVEEISTLMETSLKTFWDKEEDDFDEKMEGFEQIQEEQKLHSIWSIFEISPQDMSKKFGKVKGITYKGQEIKFGSGKALTWLQMWQEADKLMAQSGDRHHVFIEAFNEDKDNPGHYSLSCGS